MYASDILALGFAKRCGKRKNEWMDGFVRLCCHAQIQFEIVGAYLFMDNTYLEIEQIKQLKYRYVRALDTADLASMRDCLTEDAHIRFEGGVYTVDYTGIDDICAFFETSFHSKAASSHQVHHPIITMSDPAHAKGQWSLSDVFYDLNHRAIISGAAEYFDEYIKGDDGQWRIASSGYKRLYEMTQKMADDMYCTYNRLAETGKDLGLS